MEIETIPLKSFHTLFFPVYVLDGRAQSTGCPGPPKGGPSSCIGVYLGHSPFHTGSVGLVFNRTTGQISTQFHAVFDDNFSTVPYMNAGTIPPNWYDLVIHSSEVATDEDFELAQNWSSNLPPMVPEYGNPPNSGLNCITDMFVVVPDQPTATYNNNAPSHSSIPINTECEVPAELAGINGKSTSSISTYS